MKLLPIHLKPFINLSALLRYLYYILKRILSRFIKIHSDDINWVRLNNLIWLVFCLVLVVAMGVAL